MATATITRGTGHDGHAFWTVRWGPGEDGMSCAFSAKEAASMAAAVESGDVWIRRRPAEVAAVCSVCGDEIASGRCPDPQV